MLSSSSNSVCEFDKRTMFAFSSRSVREQDVLLCRDRECSSSAELCVFLAELSQSWAEEALLSAF